MRRILTGLLVGLTAILATIAVSLWWVGAKFSDTGRFERVAAAIVADPDLRSFASDQLAQSVSTVTGEDIVKVREQIGRLDPNSFVGAIKAQLSGLNVDLKKLSGQLNTGEAFAAQGFAIPVNSEAVEQQTSGLLPMLGLLRRIRDTGVLATMAAKGSFALGCVAFAISSRRRRTLLKLGRGWAIGGGAVLLFSVVVPHLIASKKGTGWAVARAWLSDDTDLTLPKMVFGAGLVCLFAGLVWPKALSTS